MSPKSVEDHIHSRIVLLNNLTRAVEQVVEQSKPLYSGSSNESFEYAVDGEAYEHMVECLAALITQQ